jgi:hypothetical protein
LNCRNLLRGSVFFLKCHQLDRASSVDPDFSTICFFDAIVPARGQLNLFYPQCGILALLEKADATAMLRPDFSANAGQRSVAGS